MKRLLTLLLTLLMVFPALADECPCARPLGEDYAVQPEYDAPAPDSSFENALLIGDSIAGSIADYNLFPALEVEHYIGLSPVLAHKGKVLKVKGEYITMFDLAVSYAPDKLLVLLGSNGLGHKHAATILPEYHALLDDLLLALPQTEIYLLSVTPVNHRALEDSPMLTMGNILDFNAGLLAMAEEHGVYYIDLLTPLLNEAGDAVQSALVAGDGVHLTPAGMTIVVDLLRRCIHP